MKRSKSVLVTCKIPRELINAIDKMVEEGIFTSRSEAIRYAIGSLIASGVPSINKKMVKESIWETI